MTSTEYQPTGYCPKCGYRLDPGVCPECGAIVARHQILPEPLHVCRRRVRRRVLAIVAVVVSVVGGCYVYSAVNWIALAPTSLLLRLQADEVHPATIELFRRYQNGNLNTAHARQMFDAVVGTPQIEIRSPAPAVAKLKVIFSPDLRIPGGPGGQGWHLFFDRWRVCVDGQPIEDRPIPHPWDCSWAGSNSLGVSIGYAYQSLDVGSHRVTLDTTIALTPDTCGVRDSATVLHTWQLHAGADLVVEDRPPEAYAEAVYTPQLREETIERLGLHASAQPLLCLTGDSPPIAVVGDLFGRPSGEARYEYLHPICVQPGVRFSGQIGLRSLTGIDSLTHVDLCVVPDALAAFEWGYDKYFGKVIEISRLPVRHDNLPWRAALSEAASEIRILDPGDPTTQPTTTAPSVQPTTEVP